MLRLIDPLAPCAPSLQLHSIAATRKLEAAAKAQAPQPSLMQRAGLAVARLSLALAPHARFIWVACGKGDNGGDGLVAAAHLQQWGKRCVVTWLGNPERASADTRAAHAQALAAGVAFATEPPAVFDFAIDALLGIGLQAARTGSGHGALTEHLALLRSSRAPVLSVDVPSGLDADSGELMSLPGAPSASIAIHSIADNVQNTPAPALFCLNLLTLKPGVFTHQGKDAAGQIWFDDLDVAELGGPTELPASAEPPGALLLLAPPPPPARFHASHKGSYGDVLVLGGDSGMQGAALLAARAALHGGAGRVWLGLLAPGPSLSHDSAQPELMLRKPQELVEPQRLASATVVCGCGGGAAVRAVLPSVLHHAQALVLDADALNAIAQDSALQALLARRQSNKALATVITPHPLEAARLLGRSTSQVQSKRQQAAQQLAERFGAVVVLKGAGTVVAAPGLLPAINASGNARLATAGTGDVLAGMLGAALAYTWKSGQGSAPAGSVLADQTASQAAYEAACCAVAQHGLRAQQWTRAQSFTAQNLLA
jgi:ADP-dependent NAD(P)H-hydrate dehydratase / NAD(P)H-hydrate epimerase